VLDQASAINDAPECHCIWQDLVDKVVLSDVKYALRDPVEVRGAT
jgi:hypothetical protein